LEAILICAIMIGRSGSVGFPGKNTAKVLGRPLCSYPLIAASGSRFIDRIYVATDSTEIKNISSKFDVEFIERPEELNSNTALGEDVFAYCFREIQRRLEGEGKTPKLIVLLFANAATVSSELIDKGILLLQDNPNLDSAVSTSIYNMWSPLRARKLNKSGHLDPFVPFEVFGDPKTLNCDRDSQGDVYYADMGVSVVRPHCLIEMEDGLLPQKWMGQKIAPIPSWGGCDVDFEWQLPLVEFWLLRNGFKVSSEE
jgi:CMP-N-acetylneuraminic acid synthetase